MTYSILIKTTNESDFVPIINSLKAIVMTAYGILIQIIHK